VEVFQMKQKFVPLEKRSKKQQKEFHSMQRKDWGNLNPATRKVPNTKAYNRKKARRWDYKHESLSGFSLWFSNYYFKDILGG